MELSFNDKAIRALCENEQTACRLLGPKIADLLKRRVADLWAATSIADLLASAPRELAGSNGAIMIIDLCDGFGITFGPNHIKNPLLPSKKPDWSRVVRVKILSIENLNA